MREIVLDTETTGLDPASGHRIVEVGCIELINHVASNRPGGTFHHYLNPERSMPAEAEAVHGLKDDFLADKPLFADIADAFLEFIGDAPLVIHNAEFDMRFLNSELTRLGHPPLPSSRAVDTLAMARRRYPGAQASLDALCRRYDIDNAGRTLHGALLDSSLLAEVYLELIGGRQPDLTLAADRAGGTAGAAATRAPRPARPHAPTPEEAKAHELFLEKIKEPIWTA
ncbi:MAG: DNA polymerase III subunit epsilon [Inquilinus sp.]|nr:DNA polymerase III subunit epsilon [Inquilinus sp.]